MKSLSARIRLAKPEDIEELVRLRCQLAAELGELALDAELDYRSALVAYLNQAIPSGEFRSWVAEADGRLVACSGLVMLHRPPSPRNRSGWQGYILNMYTEPAFRRQGLARQLVQTCIDFVQQNTAARSIFLHATEAGAPLYSSLGFKPLGSEMVLDLPS